MDSRTLLGVYFRQQGELAMPDPVLAPDMLSVLLKPSMPSAPAGLRATSPSKPAARGTDSARLHQHDSPRAERGGTDFKSKLSALRPVEQLMAVAPRPAAGRSAAASGTVGSGVPAAASGKRAALKELYLAGCSACGLAAGRIKMAFGAGNADAPVMVIGDAPGTEDNELGVPFSGAAGGLLTSMLAAIGLDRTSDVFLTNILKCPLTGGREAEEAEIAACLPMLRKQIGIIRPKAILLLGTVAAAAVLGAHGDIGELRSRMLECDGVPAMVTEHPAALLRDAALKRAAWEDLQSFKKLLASLGCYGSLDKK